MLQFLIVVSLFFTLGGLVPSSVFASEACQLTWQVVPSPNVGTIDNQLSGVAALASNDVWAAGYTLDNGTFHSLLLHWDGTTWSNFPIPDVGAIYTSIEVIASNDIWVGGNNPLHWNGTDWQVVASPKSITHLSAFGTNDIWATTNDKSILRWDGSQWNKVAFPAQPGNAILTDIRAISANEVWVVGHWYAQPQTYPIVYKWDGVQWIEQLLPAVTNVIAAAVDGVANDLWIVGGTLGDLPYAVTNHWIGSEFVSMNSDQLFPYGTASGSMYFTDVQWRSSKEVWAVGGAESYYTQRSNPLIAGWDGTQWRIHKTPILPNLHSYVSAVSALSATDIWTVGRAQLDGVDQTLIMHGTLPCVPWQNLAPKSPKLLAPADKVQLEHLPKTFKWAPVNNVLFYKFYMRRGSNVIFETLTETKRRVRRSDIDKGTYRWRVLACNDYGCSHWSQERWFTYNP